MQCRYTWIITSDNKRKWRGHDRKFGFLHVDPVLYTAWRCDTRRRGCRCITDYLLRTTKAVWLHPQSLSCNHRSIPVIFILSQDIRRFHQCPSSTGYDSVPVFIDRFKNASPYPEFPVGPSKLISPTFPQNVLAVVLERAPNVISKSLSSNWFLGKRGCGRTDNWLGGFIRIFPMPGTL
jgi:hypothetical protein